MNILTYLSKIRQPFPTMTIRPKAILSLICLCASAYLCAQSPPKHSINLVFIGNSITQGALLKDPLHEAPPVRTVEWLNQQPNISEVHYSNQGVSGNTTVDFLPATGTCFPKVVAAMQGLVQAHPNALPVFSIMLGTNDSACSGTLGAPVSGPQYYTNLKAIIDELLIHFPLAHFILHRPIWYSENTYNGARYLAEGQKRLASYTPQLAKLIGHYAQVRPDHVHEGDTQAAAYFERHHTTELIPEKGFAGTFYLHPNAQGAQKLAQLWGKAIYRVLYQAQ